MGVGSSFANESNVISIDIDGVVQSFVLDAESINSDKSAKHIIESSELLDASALQSALVFPLTLNEVMASKYVSVRTAKNIKLDLNGEVSDETSFASTVGELKRVNEKTTELSEGKEVVAAPGEDEKLVDGMTIKFTSDKEAQVVEEKEVPVSVTKQNDASLNQGQEKVVEPGLVGKEKVTYKIVTNDGIEKKREVVSKEVLVEMKPKVVVVGTKSTPTTTSAPAGSGSSAPASAPSGNSQSGQASWYDYIPGSCAHKTIGKGTVVTVRNNGNGKTTTCVVKDRGPFIAGRVIDLERGVFSQLASPGSGVISVSISW